MRTSRSCYLHPCQCQCAEQSRIIAQRSFRNHEVIQIMWMEYMLSSNFSRTAGITNRPPGKPHRRRSKWMDQKWPDNLRPRCPDSDLPAQRRRSQAHLLPGQLLPLARQIGCGCVEARFLSRLHLFVTYRAIAGPEENDFNMSTMSTPAKRTIWVDRSYDPVLHPCRGIPVEDARCVMTPPPMPVLIVR